MYPSPLPGLQWRAYARDVFGPRTAAESELFSYLTYLFTRNRSSFFNIFILLSIFSQVFSILLSMFSLVKTITLKSGREHCPSTPNVHLGRNGGPSIFFSRTWGALKGLKEGWGMSSLIKVRNFHLPYLPYFGIVLTGS